MKVMFTTDLKKKPTGNSTGNPASSKMPILFQVWIALLSSLILNTYLYIVAWKDISQHKEKKKKNDPGRSLMHRVNIANANIF